MRSGFRYFKRTVGLAILLGAQICTAHTQAATQLSDEEIQRLLRRVDELEKQVKELQSERQQTSVVVVTNLPATNALVTNVLIQPEKLKAEPTVVLGYNGLTIRSPDSNFVMIAHGYSQADYRAYFGQKTVPDTFLLRRVRPIVEGTAWHDIDYRLMLDFGSGNVAGSTVNNNAILDDAFVNAHYFAQAQIQVGKYKSPIGLERLQSTADLFFVETGFATELVPNYDLGASVHNSFFNEPVGYSVGIYSGAADNASQDADVDQGKDVQGRLFAQPFINTGGPLSHLGFGAGGSIGTHTAGSLTSYRTPGQQVFFTYTNVTPQGIQYRIDPQAYYFWGPFGLQGEYVISSQKFNTTVKSGMPHTERFNNAAWQVEASYFLTGETNSFKYTSLQHVVPNDNFGIGSGTGWGAFEFVARIQQMMLDQDSFEKFGPNRFVMSGSAQKATAWGVGLNWYLNPNLKLNLNYENTIFHGYTTTPGTTTHTPEHVILSRVQFQF